MEKGLRQRKIQKTEKAANFGIGKASNKTRIQNSLPNYFGYGFLILILFSLEIFLIFDKTFPPQLKIKDSSLYPDRFIGERAELQLKRLTDLGPRVVGSYENEVLAVDFFKREISYIAQGANKIYKIEVDIQKPTGSYYLSFKPFGFQNYYANIQNVVVKLSSSNSTDSILINCHYDTVPESPGASDNGINCVIMLEILRVISHGKQIFKNNIIFLFNGAEENPLQASHGYLSQHKWSKEIKTVINLDSAGAGGKEILFQTSGESWLLDVYKRAVPRPYGGVQAEELFLSGIIPSDTDFRIFRDFGKYSGYDFAHAFNGYIYHTKFDTMNYINPGVYQFTGDNILALAKALSNSTELGQSYHSKTKMVYFDVFQLFLPSYTETTGAIINMVIVLLSVFSILKCLKCLTDPFNSLTKNLIYSVGAQLLALLLAASVIFVISKTLDFYKSTMSWYLKPWLIIPLYFFPIVFSMAAIYFLQAMMKKTACIGHAIVHLINGAQLLWTVLLLMGTLSKIRTVFFLAMSLFPQSISVLIFTLKRKNFSVKNYLIIYMCCLILPVMYFVYQTIRIFTVIIPMTARMGPHINSEIIIAALVLIVSAISLSYIVPLFLLLEKPKRFLISLSAIHIFVILALICTNYGFPYNGDIQPPALQRFYILHCQRTFYDAKGSIRKSDSGFFVQSLDRNNLNYVSDIIPQLKTSRSASEDCEKEIYCGFPVFTSRSIRPAPYSTWIPATPPTIHHPTTLEVINQTQVLVNVRRIRLLVTGPDHISIALSPRKNVKLLKWSFDELEPEIGQSWNDRPTYMIYYSHGLMGGSLEFFVDLEIKQDLPDPVFDIAIVGHYMHDKKIRTEEFNRFLSKFPNWAHLTPWTTTYTSWIV